MDTKFAIPAKSQKLFFRLNPSETRGKIELSIPIVCQKNILKIDEDQKALV